MPRYPGGLIRKTPVTPTGPLQNGAASGVWSLADAAYWTKQGLWPLAGNTPPAIEDVFSTYLYAGDGASSQTVTTNVNLASGGGLVWQKGRNAVSAHLLFDTTRNDSDYLRTNQTNDVASFPGRTLAIGTSGFTVGSDTFVNGSGSTFATWSFKKSPKFFDLVTWTGDGTNRTIAHNLGVAPGCIIVKRLNGFSDWQVYHRSNANTQYQVLNTTAAVATGTTRWNSTTPTATEFTVGTDASVNASGGTYVAYLYAHDTSSTGLIQCGSFVRTAGLQVNLGWEPQWVLYKEITGTGPWVINDNMRGLLASGADAELQPNTSDAETSTDRININATGFAPAGGTGTSTWIYVAIRRGPMRTPTLGTSVFSPVFASGTAPTYTTGFPVDWSIFRAPSSPSNNLVGTRLLQGTGLVTESTTAAFSDTANMFDYNTGWHTGSNTGYISWNFRRAPGFFDVVAYTGTGVARALNHNLGVAPELIIIKPRSSTGSWIVGTTFGATTFTEAVLNSSGAGFFIAYDNLINAAPTSTTFSVGTSSGTNGSGDTYVAYLFASCPGVSKVGSYTGNGSSQTINCAFTTGARYVLIKRTDSTGDWYVWDSARGIVAGNDPYLALNSTAAEVTTNDSVDTDNTGFIVNQVAASNVNVNGATYIYFAVS